MSDLIHQRPSSPALERLIGRPISVTIDHIATVTVLDYMGTDRSIAADARVSHGSSAKDEAQDRSLIRRLIRDQHTSPFEMAELKLHVKLPIVVARQWIRHRTANVSEGSARYRTTAEEFWIPAPEDMRAQSRSNHQGSDGAMPGDGPAVSAAFERVSAEAFAVYTMALEQGMAREQARSILPVSTYTEWRWKCDLHNLLHFLRLRCAPDAQAEIRKFANVIAYVVERWCPITFAAWAEYRRDALTLSDTATKVVAEALRDRAGLDDLGPRLEQAGVGRTEAEQVIARLVGAA